MVKDHSDCERGNAMLPHGLLFAISSKGPFICTIPQTGEHIPWPLLHQSWSTGWIDVRMRMSLSESMGYKPKIIFRRMNL